MDNRITGARRECSWTGLHPPQLRSKSFAPGLRAARCFTRRDAPNPPAPRAASTALAPEPPAAGYFSDRAALTTFSAVIPSSFITTPPGAEMPKTSLAPHTIPTSLALGLPAARCFTRRDAPNPPAPRAALTALAPEPPAAGYFTRRDAPKPPAPRAMPTSLAPGIRARYFTQRDAPNPPAPRAASTALAPEPPAAGYFSDRAALTTFSAVIPSSFITTPPGAEMPKRSIPSEIPSSPT